jgi:choline dehydrogenase
MEREFDAIIVGGGPAGCVAAATLLAETDWRIALIEAGDVPPPASRYPARYLELQGGRCDWNWRTEPQAGLAGRRLLWPRGKMVGGCSALNALIYLDPIEQDDLHWSTCLGPQWPPGTLNDACHELRCWQPWPGSGIQLDEAPPLWPSVESLLQACRVTVPTGRWQTYPRWMHRGRRQTAFTAWLRPWFRAPGEDARRLTLLRNTQIQRICFDRQRACGVEQSDGSQIHARRLVVLAAGAIGSPHLLLRSGLGPADCLRDAGIEVRSDREAIGAGLQDHLVVPVIARVPEAAWFPVRFSAADREAWRSRGVGPMTSNLAEAGGWFGGSFAPTGASADLIQFHLTPTDYIRYPHPDSTPSVSIGVTVSRPRSRGSLIVAKAQDDRDSLRIDPRYLSEPDDVVALRHGIRIARQCLTAFAEPFGGTEAFPGQRRTSDDQLDRYVERFAQTLYHPVGSCRMGHDSSSAVDERGMVRDAERLAVVDASVFPLLPAANPQAITMAVARWLTRRLLELNL